MPTRKEQTKPAADPAQAETEVDRLKALLAERAKAQAEQNDDDEPEKQVAPVSAGPVDKIVDMVFNPSRGKMMEFTVLDRNQARLIPQLGIIDMVWEYSIEIAAFRYDKDAYAVVYSRRRPISANLMEEFMFLTAQCQKSLQGQNLRSAIDLALADVETRGGNDNIPGAGFDDE